MTPEERELRRALDSRSGEVTPEFRARLSSALADSGKPPSNVLPVLAAVAAIVLVFATVGVLLLARQSRNVPPPAGAATPSATATPTPSPTSTIVAGVLAKPSIALPTTAQLSAPSSDVIWVLMQGEYMFRSADRGAHWEQRPMLPPFHEGQVLEISFVSETEGWLTQGGSAPTSSDQCAAYSINLWHTADAGTTWQLLPSRGIALSRCKDGLSFVDSNRGFLDAWDSSHAPVIYRTLDGGRTWAPSAALPDPPGFHTQTNATMQPGAVHAFGSTLLVPAAGRQLSGNGVQDVYRSTDEGATWVFQSAALSGGSIALVTASRWIQIVLPGPSRETTNAGADWHTYPSDYTQAAPIAPQVEFADSLVGYATVRGSIARTLDGGRHWSWTAVKTPGT